MTNNNEIKLNFIYERAGIVSLNDLYITKGISKCLAVKTFRTPMKLMEQLPTLTGNILLYHKNNIHTNQFLSLLENYKNGKIFIYNSTDKNISVTFHDYTLLSSNEIPLYALSYNLYEYMFSSIIDKEFTLDNLVMTDDIKPPVNAYHYIYLINSINTVNTCYKYNKSRCEYIINTYTQWIISEVFNKSKCYYTTSEIIDPLIILAIYSNDMIICNKILYDKLLDIGVISIDVSTITDIHPIEMNKLILESNKDAINKYCNDKIEIITDVYNNKLIK
jgi:hypothetical protein